MGFSQLRWTNITSSTRSDFDDIMKAKLAILYDCFSPPYGGRVVELQVYLMVGRGSYPHTECFFHGVFTVFFTLTHVARSTRWGSTPNGVESAGS